jgi:hypothetical protein
MGAIIQARYNIQWVYQGPDELYIFVHWICSLEWTDKFQKYDNDNFFLFDKLSKRWAEHSEKRSVKHTERSTRSKRWTEHLSKGWVEHTKKPRLTPTERYA